MIFVIAGLLCWIIINQVGIEDFLGVLSVAFIIAAFVGTLFFMVFGGR